MTRMKRGLVLALASLSAACGPAGSDAGETEEKDKVTASPTGNPGLVVGDTATTADNGTTMTVLSYEAAPLRVEGAKPDRGSEYSAIEVEGCAGPSSANSLMNVGPNAFVLRLPDGARVHSEGFSGDAKVKQPALRSMNPLPGECDRGFVTFQTPGGEKPKLVLFEEEFASAATIAWKVPDGR